MAAFEPAAASGDVGCWTRLGKPPDRHSALRPRQRAGPSGLDVEKGSCDWGTRASHRLAARSTSSIVRVRLAGCRAFVRAEKSRRQRDQLTALEVTGTPSVQ